MPISLTEAYQALRQRTENKLRAVEPAVREKLFPDETKQLLTELQAPQTELEMQNVDLRAAQTVMLALRQHYFNLYDLAPVGYLILDGTGIIREANLTVATMLGFAKSILCDQPFRRNTHVRQKGIICQCG